MVRLLTSTSSFFLLRDLEGDDDAVPYLAWKLTRGGLAVGVCTPSFASGIALRLGIYEGGRVESHVSNVHGIKRVADNKANSDRGEEDMATMHVRHICLGYPYMSHDAFTINT